MQIKDFLNTYIKNAVFPSGAYYIPHSIKASIYRAIEKFYKNDFTIKWGDKKNTGLVTIRLIKIYWKQKMQK